MPIIEQLASDARLVANYGDRVVEGPREQERALLKAVVPGILIVTVLVVIPDRQGFLQRRRAVAHPPWMRS